MIVLGIVLLLIGLFFAGVKFLVGLGLLLILIGLILNFVPYGDGPRRRYW